VAERTERQRKIARIQRWMRNEGLTFDDLGFVEEFKSVHDLDDDLLAELLAEIASLRAERKASHGY
jgi:hypothetical protein